MCKLYNYLKAVQFVFYVKVYRYFKHYNQRRSNVNYFQIYSGGFLAIEKYGYSDDDHSNNYKNNKNNKITKIMKPAIDRGPYNEHLRARFERF